MGAIKPKQRIASPQELQAQVVRAVQESRESGQRGESVNRHLRAPGDLRVDIFVWAYRYGTGRDGSCAGGAHRNVE